MTKILEHEYEYLQMEVTSLRVTPWTGRSILMAESRKDHTPWSTNSWVVWFKLWNFKFTASACGEVKDISENVCKYVTPTSGKLFQPDKYNNQSINISPFVSFTLIFKEF